MSLFTFLTLTRIKQCGNMTAEVTWHKIYKRYASILTYSLCRFNQRHFKDIGINTMALIKVSKNTKETQIIPHHTNALLHTEIIHLGFSARYYRLRIRRPRGKPVFYALHMSSIPLRFFAPVHNALAAFLVKSGFFFRFL